MNQKSTGQRIFGGIAIILSAIVLLLAVGGIIGTWLLYRPVIQMTTGVLEGVDQLAQVGRNGLTRLDNRLTELRDTAGEVESAADQVAQNVADKGLLVTLLTPEKEQELEETAEQIGDTFSDWRDTIEAVREMIDAVDRLPFVDLPEPEPQRIAALDSGVSAVRSTVAELETGIREFRENTADDISTVSNAAAKVYDALGQVQDNVAEVDGRLNALQADTRQLKARISTLVTIIAVVITLLLGWSAYAMVVLIRQGWSDLRG